MTDIKLPIIDGAIVSWQYTAPLFVATTSQGELYVTRVDTGATHVFPFDNAVKVDFDLHPIDVNYRCILGNQLVDVNIETMDVEITPLSYQLGLNRSIITDSHIVLIGETVEILDATTLEQRQHYETPNGFNTGELRENTLYVSTPTNQLFQINLATGAWTNLSERGVYANQFKLWRRYLVASQHPNPQVILYDLTTWHPLTLINVTSTSPIVQADTDFAWFGVSPSVLEVLRSEGGSITKSDYEVGNSSRALRIGTAAVVDYHSPTASPCPIPAMCYQSELVLAENVFALT